MVAALCQFLAADVGGNHELADAGGADAHGGAEDEGDIGYGHEKPRGDEWSPCLEPRDALDMLDDMTYGVGGLVCAVEKLCAAAVVLEAVEDEAGEILDVEAGLDGVLTARKGEHVAAEALVETGEVAVLAIAEDDARAEDGELTVGVSLLPLAVDVLGYEFGDAVGGVWRGEGVFILLFLGGGIGGYAAGEDHASDAIFVSESGDVLGSADIGLEVGVVGMPRRAMYGSEVYDDVVGRGCDAVRNSDLLADVGVDVGGQAIMVGLDDVEVVDLGIILILEDQFRQVRAYEAAATKNEVLHLTGYELAFMCVMGFF